MVILFICLFNLICVVDELEILIKGKDRVVCGEIMCFEVDLK